MGDPIRILFLADTHLGFDLPAQPRVERRRRGHDFLANYRTALLPAVEGRVDLVVHGGDVFDRPRIAPSLAYQALEPLVQVADGGVPVYVVPGNHERSRIPHGRFATHARIHVFDRPRTFVEEVRGVRLALAGFPYERNAVRTCFSDLVRAAGLAVAGADVSLLCMHQCVEGATVGPGDFTFRSAEDVVRCRDLPPQVAAVLSGHIHRHQVLTTDLRGRPLAAPVLYAGSIERTSIAEMAEPKGYLTVEIGADAGAARVSWRFHGLPARPLVVRELNAHGLSAAALESALQAMVAALPPDAVLRIRITGRVSGPARGALSAARLRALAPATMNVEVREADAVYGRPRIRRRSSRRLSEPELPFSFTS